MSLPKKSSSDYFRSIYHDIADLGTISYPRGLKIIELENYSFTLPPYVRFTNFTSRKLNLDYIKQELMWYLRGDLYDLSIANHASIWKGLISEEGTLNSNYGYQIFSKSHQQDKNIVEISSHGDKKNSGIDWVVEELARDKDSRRASITILNNDHLNSTTKDVPCTYSLNFRIRNNKLNMSVKMRSQDAIYGMSNDIPFFSIVHEMTLKYVQEVYSEVEYGLYNHSVDSLHVYERHFEMLDRLTNNDDYTELEIPKISSASEVNYLRKMVFFANENDQPNEEYHFSKWLREVL